MPYNNAAIEDEPLPDPEGSQTAPGARSVDPNAPVGSPENPSTIENDPGNPVFHQHPRMPPGFRPFDSVDGRPYGTPPPQPKPPPPKPQPPPTTTPPAPEPYYEPYTPSEGRDHGQWGERPGPGERLPVARDLPQLLHNVVMGLGRWGSHYSGMPAIAMGTYASAYWAAYQKGMKERASDNWQKYRQARQMTLDRTKEEVQKAREGYALYKNNPDKLKQYFMDMVHDYHDQRLANALSQSPAIVYELWKSRDKWYHDLERDEARENAKKKGDELPEAWGGKPAGSTTTPAPPKQRIGPPGTVGNPPPTASAGETTPPDDTTPDEPPDEDTPPDDVADTRGEPTTTGQAPTRGVSAAPSGPPGTVPSGDPRAPPVNPLVKDSADELVRTGKVPADVPKAATDLVKTEAARQKAHLDNMISNGTITGKDPARDLATINKVNPELARDVEAMGQYKRPVPSGGENLYANMQNLVRAVYPGWDPAIYKWIEDFRLSSKPEQKMLQSVGILKGTAEAVFDALKNVEEKAPPLKNWIDYETGRVLTGNQQWAEVGQAFYDYTVRSLMAQNGGYKPQATQIKSEMERFPLTMGARAIRAMMAATAKGSISVVDTALDLYENTTHQPKEETPGYNARNVGWLRALADLDSDTGYTRGRVPVPDDMKPFLGPAGSNLHRVKSSGPMGPFRPPPPEAIAAAKKWLNDPKNANDPDRDAVKQSIGIR